MRWMAAGSASKRDMQPDVIRDLKIGAPAEEAVPRPGRARHGGLAVKQQQPGPLGR